MASTVTISTSSFGAGKTVADAFWMTFGTINLGTYATNGVAITPSQFGFPGAVEHVEMTNAAGRTYEFDKTNMKIKAYRNAAGAGDLAEVANGIDLSAAPVRFVAWGK